MVTCSSCGKNNNLQAFCGHCGTRLLADGVRLTSKTKSNESDLVTKPPIKWGKVIITFVLIWVVGGVFLDFLLAFLGIDASLYTGAIGFGVAIIVALVQITTRKDSRKDSSHEMLYTYDELCRDLEIGRELHFRYRGKEYSISHNREGTYLSEFYGDFQTFIDHIELLQKGSIRGKCLKDIWDDVVVYDALSRKHYAEEI